MDKIVIRSFGGIYMNKKYIVEHLIENTNSPNVYTKLIEDMDKQEIEELSEEREEQEEKEPEEKKNKLNKKQTEKTGIVRKTLCF